MSRKYIQLTQQQVHGWKPDGSKVELEWRAITPQTQDEAIRAHAPGQYAILGDVVYIVNQAKRERPKSPYRRRRKK